jgi:hypothetical protein
MDGGATRHRRRERRRLANNLEQTNRFEQRKKLEWNSTRAFSPQGFSVVSRARVAFCRATAAILCNALLHLTALCATACVAVFGRQEPALGRQDALLS